LSSGSICTALTTGQPIETLGAVASRVFLLLIAAITVTLLAA
jgi:hypothetical protein